MNFYQTLFNPNEQTCWSANIYGTQVAPLAEFFACPWQNELQFFSINPLQTSRADHNCTAYRNFLIEFDSISLEDQRKKIEELKLPFSTCVFSGGKSYHYILALEESLGSLEEYKVMAKAILSKVSGADQSTCNPSRFSRAPGAMRDGKEQSLVEVRARISKTELQNWLGPLPTPPIHTKLTTRGHKVLSGFTNHFLMFGAAEGERNRRLFSAACDMLRAGYSTDEILDRVSGAVDLDKKEIVATIHSALKTINRDRYYERS